MTKLRRIATLVFLATTMAAAQLYQHQLLHEFSGKAGSGEYPFHEPLAMDGAGNIFGSTSLRHDKFRDGLVFELSQANGKWTYHVLHVFTGPDGSVPIGKLYIDAQGNLYGVAGAGGASNCGVVYELSPTGSGWKYTLLHSLSPADGCFPLGGVILGKDGNFYGGANSGGANNAGTVFEMTPAGTLTVLYSFTAAQKYGPLAALVFDAQGNLYGGQGASTQENCIPGPSSVFKLSPNGDGTWTESTFYTFNSNTDGCNPQAELILDAQGNLYGTNANGGVYGKGTAFELSPSGTFNLLYSFGSVIGDKYDAAYPSGGLVFDPQGNLYGPSSGGSRFGDGTVFRLSPTGGNGPWKENFVFRFNGLNGSAPSGTLVLDDTGALYGTTFDGGSGGGQCGSGGCGVVYRLFP